MTLPSVAQMTVTVRGVLSGELTFDDLLVGVKGAGGTGNVSVVAA